MTVDPNVYALSIQLQLDSQEAFHTLDKFGESVTSVQEQVSSAADKALQSIGNLTKQIESSFSGITNLSNQMDMGASHMASSFESINRSAIDTQDTAEEDLDNLIKQRDLWKEVVDFYDGITDSLNDHLKLHTRDIALLEGIHKAILTKNKGHAEENEYIREEGGLIQKASHHGERHAGIIDQIGKLWNGVVAKLAGVIAYYEKIDSGTEAFVQTNYRAYGSQQLLLQSTRQLTAELGVSQENAIAAYKALADVRTPREEIEKYAKVVAMANRTTGANIQTLALYSARMRALGIESGPLQEHITQLTEQMRKFGLTSDDVNRLLNNTSSTTASLRDLFGGNAEEVKKFELTFGALSGLAKELGYSTESIAQFQAAAVDPKAWIMLGNLTNMQIKNTDDYQTALLKFGAQMSALQKEMDGTDDVAQKIALQAQMNKLTAAIGGNADAAKVLIGMYERASEEAGGAASTAEDFQRVMKTMSNSMDNQFAESMQAFYAALQDLKNTFGALTGSVAQFVADGLKYLMWAVNAVLKPIARAVAWFVYFTGWIEDNVPVIGWLVTAIKILVAILVVFGTIITAVIGGLAGFALAVGVAGNIVTSAINVIGTLAQTIVSLATAIGQSIVIILRSIGQGLAELGNAVRSAIGPLLALSVALVLVSVAAWIFAQAVKTIAEVGWDAVPAILGLIVTIGVLGLILVGLGMLAQGPVAVGILVVAAALLIVGAAALLMGLGIKYASEGLKELAGILTVGFVAQLPIAAAQLFMASVMMMAGASILLIAAVTLIAAGTLLVIGAGFVAVGVVAMMAAIALMSGIFVIFLVASMALNSAISLLSPAARMVASVGVMMHTGGKLLYESGKMMVTAGYDLAVGSALLAAASVKLLFASAAMIAAGGMMLPGSYMIYLGLSWLEVAVTRFSKTIDQIEVVGAGIMQLASSFTMLDNAPIGKLKSAADDALKALPSIDALAVGLDKVSGKLADSTAKFAKPANELASILERLGSSISEFGEGLTLAEDVGELATMLDQYATLLEGASDRIETAVQTRAVPAMRAAEQAGIEEAVKSEAITTVQVMTDSEGGGGNNSAELLAISSAQLVALRLLQETVAGLQSQSNNPISEILALLSTHLPSIARKDTGLSTEFNAWAK